MKRVRFTRRYVQYNSGEVAAFDDTTAAKLIKLLIAVEADVVPVPEQTVQAVVPVASTLEYQTQPKFRKRFKTG